MPTEKDLAEELARRLDRADTGGVIDSRPEAAAEILELEQLARAIESAAGARPSAAFALQSRQRVLRAIEAGPPARSARAPSRIAPSLVWASALAGAILVCLAGAGGASVAAAASLPGDVLFPAKAAFEQAALDIAPDASARVALGLEITTRRLNDSDKLIDLGRTAHAATALEAAAASLERSADLLEAVDPSGSRDQLTGELALLLPRVEKSGRDRDPFERPGVAQGHCSADACGRTCGRGGQPRRVSA
jgi:hypothetical protein